MAKVPLDAIPVLPLRDAVLFPHITLPLTVGRPGSTRLLEELNEDDKLIVVATQRDPAVDEPALTDLHPVATLARVLNYAELPQDGLRHPGEGRHYVVFAEGLKRVRLASEVEREPYLKAAVAPLPEVRTPEPARDLIARRDALKTTFSEVVQMSPTLSNNLLPVVAKLDDPAALTDVVAAELPSLTLEKRIALLGTLDVSRRLHILVEETLRERENLLLQMKIRNEVQEKVAENQKEFFLREQMKAIQKELGEGEEANPDLEELRQKIDAAELPEEAASEARRELKRLAMIPPAAAEYTVSRTYLDWLAHLPWKKTSAGEIDVRRAQEILDEDHYDLERVKERIVEYLAVLHLRHELKGPILCFVGPPGTGKTSLGKSIARALGRQFVRISLGGMHDEAEIRGHRRTYVGALPGQILHGIRRAGTRDPVFMLDEVDKLGHDFHGDPASALLEVLDPEQNFSFRDHYLDVPFDLSKVLFITTANMLDTIPPPLLDRMELLELPGYTEEEKIHIARSWLLPVEVGEHGLKLDADIAFSDEGLREIVRSYTREAGVRNLRRSIASICRKHARHVAEGSVQRLDVTPEVVRSMLGAPHYVVETELDERTRLAGVAVALAWTPQGGDILFVEAAKMPRDRGEFTITGMVGEVMEESMRAAMSWLRAHADRFHLEPREFRKYDVHLHVPSGAVPKDGPSAGVVMVAALASMFTGKPLRPRLAMTGEITLSGQLLPVGGIKEKVLAAKRSGITDIVLPVQNRPNVEEDVPEHLREGINFHFVHTVDEALTLAFGRVRERRRELAHAGK